MRVPHQQQVTPSKVAVLWKLGPQYSNMMSSYMRETFSELEANRQDTEFPDVAPPLTERESELKKELEALEEKVKKQGEKQRD